MNLWVIFAVVFLGGPAAFLLLSRRTATRGYMITVWAMTIGLMALAYGALNYGAMLSLSGAHIGLLVILCYWMAWICMLTLIMLAVRRQVTSANAHRAAFAIGAMATTLPWFGLYAATMVAD
ncbi:hypothetical protein [Roseovarius sp. MMSF_3281]|uniref:hypothetical protein n=1 Tax=Roseovarius sp. MMSF_3281 TaxID=3046694 RepID=UPI00273F1D61|nr:hypothetical protein [Roseovarius sp. MMSF_3281]